MALIWPKHGPHMVPIIWHCLVFLYLADMTLQWKFELFQASRSKYIAEIVKTWPLCGPNMAPTWLLYGPNNLTLNGNLQFSMHDSTVKTSATLKQRNCRNIQNMALIWPKHGPNMVKYGFNNWKLKSILLFSMHDYSVKIWTISGFRKQRYCRNSQNMALIWPKHHPNMVPIGQH